MTSKSGHASSEIGPATKGSIRLEAILMDVSLVDYDAGNLQSLGNAVARVGGTPKIVKTTEEIMAADRIILPGVGAAGPALRRIRERHLDDALTECVIRRGVPLLGICLGMQILADELTEHGVNKGLGWLRGRVVHLRTIAPDVRRVPHTGWSSLQIEPPWAAPFGRISGEPYFYFNHSYALRTDDEEIVVARVSHGASIPAAIVHNNIAATQFHPEISQKAGRRLLSSFLSWRP